MILVRNTRLMLIYSGDSLISQKVICGLDGHTSQKTKTTIVSEWGLEMVSEGGEKCLRGSLTIQQSSTFPFPESDAALSKF